MEQMLKFVLFYMIYISYLYIEDFSYSSLTINIYLNSFPLFENFTRHWEEKLYDHNFSDWMFTFQSLLAYILYLSSVWYCKKYIFETHFHISMFIVMEP